MDWFLYERDSRHERVKYSHFMYLSFIQELLHDAFITYQAFNFNNGKKMMNFIMFSYPTRGFL